MNEEIVGVEVKGEIYPIKDEKTSETTQTLETKITETNDKLNELENKVFRYPDYTKRITMSGGTWTADKDVYVMYGYISKSGTQSPLKINGITVSTTDISGEIRVHSFNGYVKKGSVISSGYLTSSDVTKIFPLT